MTTALNELIEWIDVYCKHQPYLVPQELKAKAQSLLPKEKEIIMNAFNEGYREGETDNRYDKRDIGEYSNAEQYFNTIFNQ